MVKSKEDMTGWVMSEHGVPGSRLIVIEQVEDYVDSKGNREAQWLCECMCKEHNKKIIRQSYLRSGHTTSCGCVAKEKASKRWIGNTYGIGRRTGNKKDLSGEHGIIWANNTNEEIYFDLEDSEKILQYTWYIGKRGYPVTCIDGKPIPMHIILGFKGYDHIDRNRLNNIKSNLRPATPTENTRNKSRQKNNTSGFIGLSWNKKREKWETYIKTDDKVIKLGYFENKIDAIKIRLQAEAKYFKEFAPQRHLFEEYGISINTEE